MCLIMYVLQGKKSVSIMKILNTDVIIYNQITSSLKFLFFNYKKCEDY